MNRVSYITEKKCRLCFETNLKSLINLGKQPLANRLKNKITSKEIKISLQLCFCKNCKTVQIKETVNPKILFKKYFWQTSTSKTAKKFSDIFCSKMLSYLSCDNPFIIEIASNDGTFLVPFKKKGYEVLGVDPATNLAIESLKNKIPTLNNFFDIPNTIPTNTNYNKIYYQNQKKPTLCDNVNHANIPCKKTCNSEEDYALSDSELAFLYKYAYEEAGNEILMRELNKE